MLIKNQIIKFILKDIFNNLKILTFFYFVLLPFLYEMFFLDKIFLEYFEMLFYINFVKLNKT